MKKLFISLLMLLSLGSMAFLSKNDREKIIFFGDSITQAAVDSGGYISQLKILLNDQNDHFELIGAGISGNKVPDLQNRLDKDVLSKNPGMVFIYIGINDVWHFSHECCRDKTGGTSRQAFEAGLNKIVRAIKENGAEVVLCTPTVIGEKKNNSNDQDAMLDEYSSISRKIAKENNVQLCDLRKVFKRYIQKNNPENLGKGVLTYDGVHLNENGNELVAKNMLKYIF